MRNEDLKLRLRLTALFWLGVGVSAAIQEAEPGQFPYTVSLQVRLPLCLSVEVYLSCLQVSGLGGHNCAGVLLSPWWVVSTGLCAQTDEDLDHDHFQVVAGEWNLAGQDGTEQVRHVETVYTHPYFSAEQAEWRPLICPNPSRYCALIVGIMVLLRQLS